jgi:serine/threonine protein phosphatase PrpC
MTSWTCAAATHVGRVREANEDAIFASESLVIVADGMGGHAAGEIASQLAIAAFREHLTSDVSLTGLSEGLRHANQRIMQDAAENPDRLGMGTTLTSVALVPFDSGHAVAWVNIGDSRLYLVRGGVAQLVTQDHSVAEEWVRQGRISKEEAAVHPRRHQLTRVLGIEPFTDGDTGLLPVAVGDRLLICSDGLSNEVSETQIADVVTNASSLDSACAALIDAALQSGGRDNISVVVVDIDSVDVVVPDTPVASVITEPTLIRRGARRTLRIPRHLTWRSTAFAGAVIALCIGVFVVFGWFAQSGYYLAEVDGKVSVYQGHAGGFLWYEPQLVLTTDFEVSKLRPGDRAQVRNHLVEPSLSAAIRHISNMHEQWRMTQPVTTTTLP